VSGGGGGGERPTEICLVTTSTQSRESATSWLARTRHTPLSTRAQPNTHRKHSIATNARHTPVPRRHTPLHGATVACTCRSTSNGRGWPLLQARSCEHPLDQQQLTQQHSNQHTRKWGWVVHSDQDQQHRLCFSHLCSPHTTALHTARYKHKCNTASVKLMLGGE
jgi:hypothetical protein